MTTQCKLDLRNGSAFTLLELMVVVCLVGLLSSVAVVQMSGPYRSAMIEQDLNSWFQFEGVCRRYSDTTNRVLAMQWNTENGQFSMTQFGDDSPNRTCRFRQIKISKVYADGKSVAADDFAWEMLPERGSVDLLLEFTDVRGAPHYFALCGMTGQAKRLEQHEFNALKEWLVSR